MNNQQQKTPESEPILELKDRVYLVPVRRRNLIIILAVLVILGAGLWGWRAYQTLDRTDSLAAAETAKPIPPPAKPPEARQDKPASASADKNIPSVSTTNEVKPDPPPPAAGPPKISFYHWRTVYQPGEISLNRMREMNSDRLYLRFFEITLDRSDWYSEPNWYSEPKPQATVIFNQKPSLPVVPIIYIDLDAFNYGHYKAEDLSAKLIKRVMDMARVHDLKMVKELHLDCDWTPSTKDKFFNLVRAVKAQLPSDWQLAVTLRLDQVKNFPITGVPPADKGVLMAYNMGDLRRTGPHNSILNPEVAAQYLNGQPYPLPLDVALPLFSWVVVFDELDKFQGLLRSIPPELKNLRCCREMGPNLFKVEQTFTTPEGWRVPAGWRLRLEESRHNDLLAVAGLLAKAVPNSQYLIFYHLDDSVLTNWPAENLDEIAGRSHDHNL